MLLLKILRQALSLWLAKEADQYAAALAYFVPFALTPLALLSLTWVGILVGRQRIAELLTVWGSVIDPEVPGLVASAISELELAGQAFSIPLVGLLFFGFMILVAFNSLTSGIHALWSIPSKGIRDLVRRYVRCVLAVVLIQVYFVLIIISFGLVTWLHDLLSIGTLHGLQYILFLTITTLLIMTLFRLLPLQTLPLRSCFYGSLVSSVLFTGLRELVTLHIATAPAANFYGAASIIIVMLIWFYTIALAILYGAAVAKIHAQITTNQ